MCTMCVCECVGLYVSVGGGGVGIWGVGGGYLKMEGGRVQGDCGESL